jgi:hypothetical protein
MAERFLTQIELGQLARTYHKAPEGEDWSRGIAKEGKAYASVTTLV